MADYRYPGLRPFEDTDLDRSLFFGRDREKEELLHLILAEKLTVVFAKSGTGKSSLLNAGILLPLRERDFLPIKARFNDSCFAPLETMYQAISSTATQQQIEEPSAEHGALADYFQAAEFWSSRDTLLTPVLILDQFEEFFETYDPAARSELITQLAECVKNRQVSVKIVIALREDYLAQLEELAPEMPEIFSHRFRLTALRREQAQAAIEYPANDFSYAPETIAAMLDFLGKRKERDKIVQTNEIEPFQLQLLCQHVENNILPKKRQRNEETVIHPGDFGGETGMEQILQEFYDKQLKRLGSFWRKRRIRKLCEKGLISATGRRLPAEEEDIQRKFRVSKTMLEELVNARLLRVEPRLGSAYYELSHDTLIKPIRASQKIRRRKNFTIGIIAIIAICIPSALLFADFWKNYLTLRQIQQHYRDADQLTFEGRLNEAITHYEKIIAASRFEAKAYLELGEIYTRQSRFQDAQKVYESVIEKGIKNNINIYYQLAKVIAENDLEKSIESYQKILTIDPQFFMAHIAIGDTYLKYSQFSKSEMAYREALKIEGDSSEAYQGLALLYMQQQKFDEALLIYKKAAPLSVSCASIYLKLLEALQNMKIELTPTQIKGHSMESETIEINKDEIADKIYKEAIEVEFDKNISTKEQGNYFSILGNKLRYMEKFELAEDAYRKAINFNEISEYYSALGATFALQEKTDKAFLAYQKAIELDQENDEAFNNLGSLFLEKEEYEKAIFYYKKSFELNPQNLSGYLNIGFALIQLKRFDDGIRIYRQVIEQAPKEPEPYRVLGDVLFKQGNYEEAIFNYENAISLSDPLCLKSCSLYYNRLGLVFEFQGQTDKAIVNYQKAIERYPYTSDYYENLERVLIKQKRFNEFLITQQMKSDFAPTDSVLIGTLHVESMSADGYKERGEEMEGKGNYEAAIVAYQNAVDLEPQNADVHERLGRLLLITGKYQEAFEHYNKSLEFNKDSTSLSLFYIQSGNILYQYNCYDEAISQYQKAIELNPNDSDAYRGIGDALYMQDKYEAAITSYQKAIELNPNDIESYNSLGGIYYALYNYQYAYEMYKKAYQLAPEEIWIKMNLTENCLGSEHFEQAVTLVHEILQEKNFTPQAILTMRFIAAAALLLQEKRDDAFSELRKLIEFHASLTQDFEKGWSYNGTRHFLSTTDKLKNADRTLLLTLIDILEDPKAEGEKKLQALKAQFPGLE